VTLSPIVIVHTSSAKAPAFGLIFLCESGVCNSIAFILLFLFMFLIKGSIQIMNNAQLNASPCFTHLRIFIKAVLYPFTSISASMFIYSNLTTTMNSSEKP